jgi:hypothetical protein
MSNAKILCVGCLAATVLGVVMVTTASAQRIYAPPVAGVRVYGYVAYPYGYYASRRVVRQAVRYGYVPMPLPAVVVRGPSDFLASPSYRFPYYGSPYYGSPYYGSPYYGVLKPPYRGGPAVPSQIPPPPDPQKPSTLPGQLPSQPAPSVTPTPEAIPTPPSELGPREF